MRQFFAHQKVLSGDTASGRKLSRIWEPAWFAGWSRRALILFLAVLVLAGGAGCLSWTAPDGTRHTVIIGIGLVSQKESSDRTATALRSQTLGLAVRPGPPRGGLVLGYQSLQQTAIAPGWEGVVQVSATTGEPLTVTGMGGALSTPMTSKPEKEDNRCVPQPAPEWASAP